MVDDGDIFAMRQKPCRQFTAAQVKDQTVLSQHVRKKTKPTHLKNHHITSEHFMIC